MPGAGDEDGVEVTLADHPIHVGVQQVEPGRCAPMSEQARLHVLDGERLAQ